MPNITHQFVSGKADSGDASVVQPSNWNSNHTITWADEYFTATDLQTTFTPAVAPVSYALVFVNGLKQRNGASYDYQIIGASIVFNAGLIAGQIVEVLQ